MAEIKVLEAFGEQIAEGGEETFVFGFIEKIPDFSIDCLTPYKCWSKNYESMMQKRGGNIYSLNLPFAPGKSRHNIYAPFHSFLNRHHDKE